MPTRRATRVFGLLGLALGAGAIPSWAQSSDANWSVTDVQRIVGELAAAGQAASVEQRDTALAAVAARAYGQAAPPGSTPARFQLKVLRSQVPGHPDVKPGQELLALMRQLYADLAARSSQLARFESKRSARQRLEQHAREASAAAATLGRELQVELPGLKGYLSLPPKVKKGDDPRPFGARAEVSGGRLIVERLPRARFVGDRAAPDEPRTSQGALREVRASLKQFNTTASMLGQYDRGWRRRRGRVHFVAPAEAPAAYLREVVLAAREADFKTVNVVVLDAQDEVRALPIRVRSKGLKKPVEVRCPAAEEMQQCAERIFRSRKRGTPVFGV